MANDERTDCDQVASPGGADVRRFVAAEWSLFDVPHDSPVNLLDQWMRRFGGVPNPWEMMVGLHFPLNDGARGVQVLRPYEGPNVESLRAMALSLVGAKYRVETRLAEQKGPETPNSEPDLDRLLHDDRIEIWPPPPERPMPVVLANISGRYVREGCRDDLFDILCTNPGHAEVFATADEAEAWAEIYLPRHHLTPVYLAVAQARFEQRQAAQVDEAGGSSPGGRARPPRR